MNPNIRIGHGYDCHRLALPPEGGPLVLGGLHIEHKMGPVAHSDGDALLHAVTDAVLGALGLDDLGTQFPDNDPRWRCLIRSIFTGGCPSGSELGLESRQCGRDRSAGTPSVDPASIGVARKPLQIARCPYGIRQRERQKRRGAWASGSR